MKNKIGVMKKGEMRGARIGWYDFDHLACESFIFLSATCFVPFSFIGTASSAGNMNSVAHFSSGACFLSLDLA